MNWNLLAFVRRLAVHKRGNVLMIFAFAVVPMVFATGMGIDYARAARLRTKLNAIADAATMLARRDKDAFDKVCDHLMVIDHAAKPSLSGKQPVVGTYRLLRQDVAEASGGFYSEDEFDIASLIERHASLRFLELGRSCVLPPYRTKRTVELLWHGVWRNLRRMISLKSSVGAKISLPLLRSILPSCSSK